MTRRVLPAVMASAVAFLVLLPAPAAEAAPNPVCVLKPEICGAVGLASTAAGALAGGTVSSVGNSVVDGLAASFGQGAATVVREVFGWWLRTPTVSIADSGVLKLQGVMLGLAAVVGMILVTVQGIRLMVSRKPGPLGELVQGSIVAAVVTVAGVGMVDAALVAGDRLAESILTQGFASSDKLVERMVTVLTGDQSGVTGGLLLLFAVVVILVGLVQAVLFFLRQAAVPLLAVMFPIIAVGQLGPASTRQWLPKVLTVVLAIVVYKPLVALILSVGFVEIADGSSVLDVVRGIVTLALSVLALPAMLKLFAPLGVVGANALTAGSGGALLGAAASVGTMLAMRGHGTPGDTSAAQQAAHVQATGPTGSPTGGGGANDSGGGGPRPQPDAPPGGGGAPAAAAAAAGSAPPGTAPTSSPAGVGAGAGTAGAGTAAAASTPAAVVVVAGEAVKSTQAAGRAAADHVTAGADGGAAR